MDGKYIAALIGYTFGGAIGVIGILTFIWALIVGLIVGVSKIIKHQAPNWLTSYPTKYMIMISLAYGIYATWKMYFN